MVKKNIALPTEKDYRQYKKINLSKSFFKTLLLLFLILALLVFGALMSLQQIKIPGFY